MYSWPSCTEGTCVWVLGAVKPWFYSVTDLCRVDPQSVTDLERVVRRWLGLRVVVVAADDHVDAVRHTQSPDKLLRVHAGISRANGDLENKQGRLSELSSYGRR